ncbi:MAG: group II intron maturase-specific domain-containing protein [Prochlorotrichaceae cyanobacterium]
MWVERLNPKIIGWANYYAKAVSSLVFGAIDHWLYQQLRIWANHRHSH